jgi:hypothetical protein
VYSHVEAFTRTGQAILVEDAAEGPLPHAPVVDLEEVFPIHDTGAAAMHSLFKHAQCCGVDLALARVHPGPHST